MKIIASNIEYFESIYLNAKEAYYNGEPIMTDAEFDELEEELQKLNSSVVNIVGSTENTIKPKYPHISKMLSLRKIKSPDNVKLPIDELERWLKRFRKNALFELTPKYDGNAVNVIYKNGTLHQALTRGDGKVGQDVTDKLDLPETINTKFDIVEIRGEVVIENEKFQKYEAEYKNARNFVAGILNRKDTTLNPKEFLTFIPFIIKQYDSQNAVSYSETLINDLKKYKFNHFPYIITNVDLHKKSFETLFNHFLEYRQTKSPYRLDGFVIKVEGSNNRIRSGETDHHPEWGLAVKFKPEDVITEIVDIEWNMGKTGEFTPVGILKPVDLDGSIVTRVSLHNVDYVTKNKLLPGAVISLVKSGDIIPMVANIVSESSLESTSVIPTTCPYCGEKLEHTIHLSCINNSCPTRKLNMFKFNISILNMPFFGHKMIERIFQGGITNAFEIFDKKKFNRKFLISTGLPDGKTIDRVLNELYKINSLTLEKVIQMMNIKNLGRRGSAEVARFFAGISYQDYGLQKSFFTEFAPGSKGEAKLLKIIDYLNKRNIEVIFPEEEAEIREDNALLIYTGSPKSHGFETKSEFNNIVKPFGYCETGDIKLAKYIITDSYESNTSKIKKAKELNKEIYTYSDFIKLIKEK